MDLAKLIPIGLKASIMLIVFGLGLKATFAEATSLFRQPGLLLRSLLAMNVVMPLLVGVLVSFFDLNPAIKIALVLLAVSPVPPILPKKQFKADASESYIYGLLTAAALCAIVLVPLSVKLLGAAFGQAVSVPMAVVAQVVLLTILLPLAAGMLVKRLAPSFAQQIEPFISGLAGVLLVIGVVLVLIGMWPGMAALVGDGTLVALVLVGLLGLLVGHLLGGPDTDDRSALALACAARHPGVALAVAGINFAGNKSVVVAVLLSLLVSAVVSIPYVLWRKHQHGGMRGAAAAGHG